MNNRSILITVGTLEEMGKEFISTWHEAEEGKISKSSIVEKIYFKDEILFFKTLTPTRFNLIKKLHELGESSIRSLSKALDRDYKNVFDDVKALNQIDLILKNNEGKYYVPWQSIITEISMKPRKPLVTKIRQNSTKSNPNKKRAIG